ncbi:uncharacterized protein ACOB8E_019191 isoform 1-T1 [Sarcophilus harrisii]
MAFLRVGQAGAHDRCALPLEPSPLSPLSPPPRAGLPTRSKRPRLKFRLSSISKLAAPRLPWTEEKQNKTLNTAWPSRFPDIPWLNEKDGRQKEGLGTLCHV